MERVLITGAGRGIGLALATRAIERGDRVWATVRDASRAPGLHRLEQRSAGRLRVVPLDVTSPASIEGCHARIAADTDALDLLVNNAGVNSQSRDIAEEGRNQVLGELEAEGLVQMFRVNAVGPALVTQRFVELLERGARPRVISLSTRRASLHEKTSGGNYGYCMSKAALNMVSRALAADLLPRSVVCVVMNPGAVRTDMAMPDAFLEPEDCAEAILDVADALGPEDAGRFIRWDGTDHPW